MSQPVQHARTERHAQAMSCRRAFPIIPHLRHTDHIGEDPLRVAGRWRAGAELIEKDVFQPSISQTRWALADVVATHRGEPNRPMHPRRAFSSNTITAFARPSVTVHTSLTTFCQRRQEVHAILGIRPPAKTDETRLGLPGSHGPGR